MESLHRHQDELSPRRVPHTFHSTDATLATYTAPSGAIVLAASSIDFGWSISGSATGLEVASGMSDPEHPSDARMQRLVRNARADVLRAR
jgi:hypothetical protein